MKRLTGLAGVTATGVLDGGEPASGITRGLRVYFVADDGLRPVPRPGPPLKDLATVVKHLMAGPTEVEQRAGLTTLVRGGSYEVTGKGAEIDVQITRVVFDGGGSDELVSGQLVCTLARAQSQLVPGIRPDEVRVTLGNQGPFTCADFRKN
ncbi:hypothetical protein CP968_04685 [Streptomyces subrutilus]|uniref:GerMN domain-containing protein n=1 Tax=Streptomyces subrutilus TaxID=36818 RepID=A0A5P2UUB9_9ACTN|nr:hypothetical protein CP968_04685 [Streptomyces subrutilus]